MFCVCNRIAMKYLNPALLGQHNIANRFLMYCCGRNLTECGYWPSSHYILQFPATFLRLSPTLRTLFQAKVIFASSFRNVYSMYVFPLKSPPTISNLNFKFYSTIRLIVVCVCPPILY